MKIIEAPHMFKAPHIMFKAPHIMFKAPHIMFKAPHIILKAPHVMFKAPYIMYKAPNEMTFYHLRQLWLSIWGVFIGKGARTIFVTCAQILKRQYTKVHLSNRRQNFRLLPDVKRAKRVRFRPFIFSSACGVSTLAGFLLYKQRHQILPCQLRFGGAGYASMVCRGIGRGQRVVGVPRSMRRAAWELGLCNGCSALS